LRPVPALDFRRARGEVGAAGASNRALPNSLVLEHDPEKHAL